MDSATKSPHGTVEGRRQKELTESASYLRAG